MHTSQITSPSTSRPEALPIETWGQVPKDARTVRILTSLSSVPQEISSSFSATTDLYTGAPPQWLRAKPISRELPAREGPSKPLPHPSGPPVSVCSSPEQFLATRLLTGSSRQDQVLKTFPVPSQPIASSSTGPSISDPEGTYYAAFEEAYETNNSEGQIYNLEKMADLSIEKGDLIKAAHLLNGALAVALKSETSNNHQRHFFSRLEGLEGLFLEKTFGKKAPTSHHHYLFKYRETLQNVRAEVGIKLTNQEPAEAIQRFITEQYQQLLGTLIEESIALIGETPPPFAVMGLGSLARMEACPYSDIEFAIVVADEKSKTLAYFRNLSSFLELKITNLGETKWPIIRPKRIDGVMREAASLTSGGFSMDIGGLSPLGKTGVYELIGTPKKLASFQDPAWFQRNEGELILVNALTCVSSIYGEVTLVKKYKQEMHRWLGIREEKKRSKLKIFTKRKKAAVFEHKNRAQVLLLGHLAEFKPYLTDDRIAIRAYDVKKDFYRPIQMALTGLLLYHGLGCHPSLEGINLLQDRGIISQDGANHLRQALRTALIFRIKAHLFYEKEKEILYFRRGDDFESEGLFIIDDPQIILETYRVLTDLHKEMELFVENPERSLSQSIFYDESLGLLNTQAENDLNYHVAASSYLRAVALNPEDRVALKRLGDVQLTLKDVQAAIKCYKEELRILREHYGSRPHYAVVTSLTNLGNSYKALNETARAIEYFEEALKMSVLLYANQPDRDVAELLSSLGFAYFHVAETRLAIEYHEKALKMMKLISVAPSVYATSLGFLSHAYAVLDEMETSQEYARQASEACRAQSEPSGAISQTKYHKRELERKKLIYGEKPHSSVADSLNAIGRSYWGKHERAIEYHEQALAMRKLLYDNKPHQEIAESLRNLGDNYKYFNKNYEQSIKYYEQSLEMNKNIHGNKPNLDIATLLVDLGAVYLRNEIPPVFQDYNQADVVRAFEYFDQASTMFKFLSADNTLPYNQSMSSLRFYYNERGDAYYKTQEVARAIEYYEKALKIDKLMGTSQDTGIGTSLINLGNAYMALNNPIRAIDYFNEAVVTLRQFFNNRPSFTLLRALDCLVAALRQAGNFDQYDKLYIEAEEMRIFLADKDFTG